MNCEDLRHEYQAYALGVADEPERFEIAQHLARNCPNCVPGVRRAMETVAAMSGAVKMADPPKRLRSRVTAMVAPERRSWIPTFVPWALASALALALVYIAVVRRPNTAASSKLEEALSVMSDPATRDVTFGQPTAKGRVFVSPDRGVVFIATGLPALGENKTFELWLIPSAGKPVPAGTFRGQADSAIYVRPGPATNAAAVAVTIEPEGGSPQPTTTPFIVAKL